MNLQVQKFSILFKSLFNYFRTKNLVVSLLALIINKSQIQRARGSVVQGAMPGITETH